MSLKQTIENEYKNALKSKDKNKISTYRLILSSIKDLDIVNRSGPNKKETDDEDIKKLLKKMVKQRAESIDIYKKNNRQDLLEVEKKEQVIEESPTDSLKLEVAKDKNESKDLSPPAPEESQPETDQKIEEDEKLNEPDDEETNSE